MLKLVLATSGVARGDPPQAAIGVILTDAQGRSFAKLGRTVGRASQAVAEYKALLEGLELASHHQPQELVAFVDSQQLANQVLGVVPPREPALQYLDRRVQEGLQVFPRWRVSYVDEDVCRPARRLAEQALFEERQSERERAAMRQKIFLILDVLSLEELHKVLNFAQSLQMSKG